MRKVSTVVRTQLTSIFQLRQGLYLKMVVDSRNDPIKCSPAVSYGRFLVKLSRSAFRKANLLALRTCIEQLSYRDIVVSEWNYKC